MNPQKKYSLSPNLVQSKRRRGQNHAVVVLVVGVEGNEVFAAAASSEIGEAVRLRNHDEVIEMKGTWGHHVEFVLAVPKAAYIRKVFEVAREGEEDAGAILELQVEAWLPPEYGPRVTSTRQLGLGPSGGLLFEVYVVKANDWTGWVTFLESIGLVPTLILPCAVLWDEIWPRNGRRAILGNMGNNRWELIYRELDDQLVVRSLSTETANSNTVAKALAALPSDFRKPDQTPIQVTLCGSIKDEIGNLSEIEFNSLLVSDRPEDPCPFATAAASALLNRQSCSTLRRSSMVSQEVAERAHRTAMRRVVGRTFALYLLTLALLALGFKVLEIRTREQVGQLTKEVQAIRVNGESTGRQLRQLAVARAAAASRESFLNIFDALLRYTPDGMSYNRVDIDSSGGIQLRGQADSLSKPFELPQRLEKVYPFQNVKCSQAFTAHTSDGAAAEFQIDAREIGGGSHATVE